MSIIIVLLSFFILLNIFIPRDIFEFYKKIFLILTKKLYLLIKQIIERVLQEDYVDPSSIKKETSEHLFFIVTCFLISLWIVTRFSGSWTVHFDLKSNFGFTSLLMSSSFLVVTSSLCFFLWGLQFSLRRKNEIKYGIILYCKFYTYILAGLLFIFISISLIKIEYFYSLDTSKFLVTFEILILLLFLGLFFLKPIKIQWLITTAISLAIILYIFTTSLVIAPLTLAASKNITLDLNPYKEVNDRILFELKILSVYRFENYEITVNNKPVKIISKSNDLRKTEYSDSSIISPYIFLFQPNNRYQELVVFVFPVKDIQPINQIAFIPIKIKPIVETLNNEFKPWGVLSPNKHPITIDFFYNKSTKVN